MLELKAKSTLEDVHYVQTLSYLKASGYTIALLLNFGAARLEIGASQTNARKTAESPRG
jgi:GxxExxY protein